MLGLGWEHPSRRAEDGKRRRPSTKFAPVLAKDAPTDVAAPQAPTRAASRPPQRPRPRGRRPSPAFSRKRARRSLSLRGYDARSQRAHPHLLFGPHSSDPTTAEPPSGPTAATFSHGYNEAPVSAKVSFHREAAFRPNRQSLRLALPLGPQHFLEEVVTPNFYCRRVVTPKGRDTRGFGLCAERAGYMAYAVYGLTPPVLLQKRSDAADGALIKVVTPNGATVREFILVCCRKRRCAMFVRCV